MASAETPAAVVEYLAIARRRTSLLRALANRTAPGSLRALDLEMLASLLVHPDDRRARHAERLEITRGAVTQCLDRLGAAGLVAFERPSRASAEPVELTQTGKRTADQALEILAGR